MELSSFPYFEGIDLGDLPRVFLETGTNLETNGPTHQVDQGRHRFSGKNQAPWALVNPRGWVGRLGGWVGVGFGSVRKMIVVLVDCCFVKCDLN